MSRGQMGWKGQLGICPPNMTNFLLLNPDFFQRANAKGSARVFFGGWFP
jgi:hypothetical protein